MPTYSARCHSFSPAVSPGRTITGGSAPCDVPASTTSGHSRPFAPCSVESATQPSRWIVAVAVSDDASQTRKSRGLVRRKSADQAARASAAASAPSPAIGRSSVARATRSSSEPPALATACHQPARMEQRGSSSSARLRGQRRSIAASSASARPSVSRAQARRTSIASKRVQKPRSAARAIATTARPGAVFQAPFARSIFWAGTPAASRALAISSSSALSGASTTTLSGRSATHSARCTASTTRSVCGASAAWVWSKRSTRP